MQSNRLGIIPARLGSKGFPGKNTAILNGKPLVTWTIEAAILSECFERIIVSSDDKNVLEIAESFGGIVEPYKRKVELSQDSTSGSEVAMDVVENTEHQDVGVFLQPTSPLRSADDIRAVCELAERNDYPSVVSLTEVTKSPNWMYSFNNRNNSLERYEKNNDLVTIRQDLNRLYQLNGAIYFFEVEWFLKSKSLVSENSRGYIMPPHRSVDIDTRFDLFLAEQIFSHSNDYGFQ